MKTINVFLVLLLLSSLLLATGCNRSPNETKEKEGNNPPKVPDILEEMEIHVLEIMYDIDSIKGISITMMEKNQEASPKEADLEMETGGDVETEIKLKPKEEEEKDTQKKMERNIEKSSVLIPLLQQDEIEGTTADLKEPPEDMEEIWFQINGEVEKLHRQWNVLEADLRDVKIPLENIDKFEETLTQASLLVMEEKVEDSLMIFNELTQYLGEFRNFFTTKVPGEVYKMKYHIRHSVFLASLDEYEKAKDHIEKTRELKNGLQKDLIEKDADHVVEKFDLSIEDLKKQLELQELDLIQTDGAIVIKNIVLIKEAFQGS